MNQKEKSQISKDKILSAAIAEFGTNSFVDASLNNICNNNNISKGLIYHYFKNKDELFLCCVKDCFDKLVAYLENRDSTMADFQNSMQEYLDLRYRFFQENPYYSNIFFNTILQPPKHLTLQIKELRKSFDTLNMNYYKNILEKITLRDNITPDEAMEFFYIFQEMFNGYFQSKAYESSDFSSLIEAHKINLPKILDLMLYGIAKEDTEA